MYNEKPTEGCSCARDTYLDAKKNVMSTVVSTASILLSFLG